MLLWYIKTRPEKSIQLLAKLILFWEWAFIEGSNYSRHESMLQTWRMLDFKEPLFVISTGWKGATNYKEYSTIYNSNFLSIAIDYSCLTTEVMQILLCFQLSITLVREESQNVFRMGGGAQMPSKPSILQSLCTRKALLYFVFPFLGSFINLVFSYLLCPSCLPALFFAFLFSWVSSFFFCCYFRSLIWGWDFESRMPEGS